MSTKADTKNVKGIFMKTKISSWDGKKMTPIREMKVETLSDILFEIRWMNDNNIHGSFEFVCEDKQDEEILEMIKMKYIN